MVSQPQDVAGEAELDLVWRCSVCGYQRMSAESPERCAACGAGREHLVGHTSVQWRMLLRHAAEADGE